MGFYKSLYNMLFWEKKICRAKETSTKYLKHWIWIQFISYRILYKKISVLRKNLVVENWTINISSKEGGKIKLRY